MSRFQRAIGATLVRRLKEPPNKICVIAGPRQVGKTTLVRQVLSRLPSSRVRFLNADAPDALPAASSLGIVERLTQPQIGRQADAEWLVAEWQAAAIAATSASRTAWPDGLAQSPNFVLVIDEVQKIPRWSQVVKGLFDDSQARGIPMHVVMLGSAPMLVQQGLTESLMGRFELIRMPHWSLDEMHDAFGLTLAEFVHFGSYPYAATLRRDESRWRAYVRESLIAPSIDLDVLQMSRIEKPALMRQLFEMGCQYSAQIVSLTKMVGALQDAGNTTTLTGYLNLLSQAGLLTALSKYSPQVLRQRASKPKFQVLNTGLQTACGHLNFQQAREDPRHWGRCVESAVGAHLLNSGDPETQVHYWNESPHEVDFVVTYRGRCAAIEVKSGKPRADRAGLREFQQRFGQCSTHVVGESGIGLAEFLSHPASHWVA